MRATLGGVRACMVALVIQGGVTGCERPPLVDSPRQEVSSIRGHLMWGDRTSLAQLSEVSSGATVSLIDTTTGQTVGTTVTQASGAFVLNFGASFRPTAGRPYYLEAVRGLPVALGANRAGTSLARIRTLLFHENAAWKSLTSGTLAIGPATTAICTLVSLRGLSVGQQHDLLATVTGSAFSAAGTAIASAEFTHVYGLVTAALQQDQDPLQGISYDPAGAGVTGQYLVKPRDLVLHESFSPPEASAGGNATFYGQNLPLTDATVSVGGVPVATWSVKAPRTQLSVTLPSTVTSGYLKLNQGITWWVGPFMPVTGTVGTFAGSGYPYMDGERGMAGFDTAYGIAFNPAGELFLADSAAARIRKILPTGKVTTFAGDGVSGASDGMGPAARFYAPCDVCTDSSGNVYVADFGNHKIRRISPLGVVTTLAGEGSAGNADGPGSTARFNQPSGIVADAVGNLYVADRGSHRLRKVTPSGEVSTLAGSSAGFLDATGTAAQFNTPMGIALDASGNLLIGDYGTHRIRRVTPAGVVTTLAGNGTASSVDGTGTGATFNSPRGLAVDGAGNVYTTEWAGHRVRKITPAGVTSLVAGTGTAGFLDAPATAAQFRYPHKVILDAAGNLYVADASNLRVRVVAL